MIEDTADRIHHHVLDLDEIIRHFATRSGISSLKNSSFTAGVTAA